MPSNGRFQRWGLDIPISRVAGSILVSIGIVAILFGFYVKAIHPIVFPPHVPVPKEELYQLQESMKHFSEPELEIFGSNHFRLKLYEDLCWAVTWKVADGEITKFVFHPSRTFDLNPHPPDPGAAAKKCPREGQCVDPHPGKFFESRKPIDDCIIRIYREWDDGCAHHQDYNTCKDTWGKVLWLCCVH